jgi:putative phosphoribosyl transferase
VFRDRREAGERLADRLADLGEIRGRDLTVLGIPRGGVVVADAVAERFAAPLDVVIPRKLGAPGNPELAIGAVAPGVRVLDERMVRALGVPESYLDREVARAEQEIERRERRYRAGLPPLELNGRAAVVVDDGVATGSTAVAALRWARAGGAAAVVLGVPVAPAPTVRQLAREADEVVALETPDLFHAVGQWYRHFGQVSDEEVVRILERRSSVAL